MKLLDQIVQRSKTILEPKYTVISFNGDNLDECVHLIKTASTKHIAFFSHDHWGDDNTFFLPLENRPLNLVNEFKILANQMRETNFLICSTMVNHAQKFEELPNVRVLHIGDEMVLHPFGYYRGTIPQIKKNFNSQKHWINLNHNSRIYRNILGCYLLGSDLTDTGILRIDCSRMLEHESWHTFTEYCKYNNNFEIFQIADWFPTMSKGFEKLKNQQDYVKLTYRMSGKIINDPENFDQRLRGLYENSFVEIICDTIFMDTSGLVTEKFINSVYGFNFPIIMNIPGAVDHLRGSGFDMFDDVINHRYDKIHDPFTRMITAINDNRAILSDSSLAKSKWVECQDRLNNNYLLADNLYSTVVDRAIKKINYTLSV